MLHLESVRYRHHCREMRKLGGLLPSITGRVRRKYARCHTFSLYSPRTNLREALAAIFHYRQCLTQAFCTESDYNTEPYTGPQTLPSWAMNWQESCPKSEVDIIRWLAKSSSAAKLKVLSGSWQPDYPSGEVPVPEQHGENMHVNGRVFEIISRLTDWTCELSTFLALTADANNIPELQREIFNRPTLFNDEYDKEVARGS